MASVTLDTSWLHLQSSLSTYVQVPLASEAVKEAGVGRVSRYAGGRLRSVSRPGTQRVVTCSASFVPRATVELLRAWVNVPLVFRDPSGRQFGVVYFDLSVTEVPGTVGVADVALVLAEVSWSAAV